MRKELPLVFLCLVLLLSSGAGGKSFGESMTFSPAELTIDTKDGYHIVRLPNCHFTSEAGEPMMPSFSVQVNIPRGMKVKDLKIGQSLAHEIPGDYLIFPAQRPRPFSQYGPDEFVQPKESVYQSSFPYPGKLIEVVNSGYLAGHNLVSLLVYPVEYVPSTGKLVLNTEIRFELELEFSDDPAPRISKRSRRAEKLISQMVKDVVINPQDVEECVAENVVQSTRQQQVLEYVIITKAEYFDEFQPLIEWKTKKGIPAVVRDVDWITSIYAGRDDQERIRNYIKDLESDSGTVWVLLGGDVQQVPHRGVYCHVDHPETDSTIPCDSYYANLSGTWDQDGDDLFGEVPFDNVDFYPDVWLGRATVDQESEVTRFVNKVLTYEKSPELTYLTKALFFTCWLDAQTDPQVLKQAIDNNWMPAYFDVDYLSEVHRDVVKDSLSQGYNIINQGSHGDATIIWTRNTPQSWLRNTDMLNLSNGPKYTGFLYAMGCNCGAFDFADCIGESFFESYNGGGSFVGQSRFGWYQIGNPTGGSTAAFDNQFFRSLFNNNEYQLGNTLAHCKQQLASYASSNAYYRWVYYCLNLLGDPELCIWTDTPDSLSATHPDSIFAGTSEPCTVTVTSQGSPVSLATVCLWKEDEVHLVESTNIDGIAVFYPSTSSPGSLWVTATKQNYIPCDSFAVVHGCPAPLADFSADPSAGQAPLQVHFSDQSFGWIDNWYWQFGDGQNSYDPDPIHTYQNCGRYDVTLSVCNPPVCDPVVCDTVTKSSFIWVWADTLIVPNASAAPDQAGKQIRIRGVSCDSLAGYGMAMYFDTMFLDVDTVTLDGTCGEGAQINMGGVGFDTSLGLAYLTWGVVYTFVPPWIPAGSDYFFNVVVTIKDSASLPSIPCTTYLNLENDVGPFQTDNSFTTYDDLGIYPVLVDGRLIIGGPEIGFIRGDALGDDGLLAMSDAVYILRWLYVPGTPDFPCFDAADVGDEGDITMSDAIYLLKYLYVPGEPPPPPPCCVFPVDCEPDPTTDALECEDHPCSGAKTFQAEPDVGGEMILGDAIIQNQRVTVPVYLRNGGPLSGFSYTISYDPEVLTFKFADNANLLTGDFDFFSARPDEEAGSVNVGGLVDMGLKESLTPGHHEVTHLIFELRTDELQETILEFSDVELVDTEANPLDALTNTCTVRVSFRRPQVFAINQNYPNPVRDWTTIRYQLPRPAHTTLRIYNLAGQVVKTLTNEAEASGYYTATWDRTDDLGRRVSSGVYFYRLKADELSCTRKLVVVE